MSDGQKFTWALSLFVVFMIGLGVGLQIEREIHRRELKEVSDYAVKAINHVKDETIKAMRGEE